MYFINKLNYKILKNNFAVQLANLDELIAKRPTMNQDLLTDFKKY